MSYDPTIGRFISEDPIAFDSGDADLYRYVGNDPTNLIDPTGLAATIVIYINTTGAPPGFNIGQVQTNLQAIMNSGGGKTPILLIPTDKPQSWYEDQYNLTLGWNYDRNSWLWNAGWWNLDPFCGIPNLIQRPFYWWNRQTTYYIGYVQFTTATGAIGSHGNNTANINLGSIENAGQQLGYNVSTSTLYANIIFHEMIYHGVVGGFDDPFAADNTFTSTVQNSQMLMQLTPGDAERIDNRCK